MVKTIQIQKRFYKSREIDSKSDIKRYWPDVWPRTKSCIDTFENEIFTGEKHFKVVSRKVWDKYYSSIKTDKS